MKEESKDIPQLNVTAKWLDSIYERIEKITNLERVCRSGIPSDTKGIEIFDGEQRAEYQSRMLLLLVDEIEMLLPDIKKKLKSDDYKEIALKLIFTKKRLGKKIMDGFYDYVSYNPPEFYLTDNYHVVLRSLSEVRAIIVNHLSPLLYGEVEVENDRRNIR